MFRHKFRKPATVSFLFYFYFLMGIVASVTARSFCFYGWGLGLKYFRLAAPRKPLQLETRTKLTRTEFFGAFRWNRPCFVDLICAWTEICMKCSVVILSSGYHSFSIFCLRGVLVCSSKLLVFFSHTFW